MKLVYVANVRVPTEKAHGIQVMKMCEAFSGIGNNVELWVPDRQTKIKDDAFDFYGIHTRFEIKRLWCLDIVHMGRLGYRIEMLTFLFSCFIKSFFKRAVFYTREESVACTFSLLGKRVFWEDHRGHMNVFVRAAILMKVPIISISKGLKDFYVSLGVPADRVRVAPDAVDLKQFQITITKEESRKRLGLPLDKKIVMYIGLFEDWKGYKTVLEASALIPDNNVQFVMIGESKNIDELRTMHPNVIFTGYRPYKELSINQLSADILLVPNSAKEKISSHFTSPIKLFAHMASGVPIVASDVPSLREIIDTGTANFFIADDSYSMVTAIKSVLLDLVESKNKALQAKQKVKKYTWAARAESLLEFINI